MLFLDKRFLVCMGVFVCLMTQGLSVFALYENKDLRFSDPRSSEGKSGIDTPREYFLPNEPDYERWDPQEFEDYRKKAYSPYAQLQVLQPIQVGETSLQQGYYLVKLVKNPPISLDKSSGTTTTKPSLFEKWHWVSTEKNSPAYVQNHPRQYPLFQPETTSVVSQPMETDAEKLYLMIKKEGQVDMVIPVEKTTAGKKQLKKNAMAQLQIETNNVVNPQLVYLEYCTAQFCYRSVPLAPGLLQ